MTDRSSDLTELYEVRRPGTPVHWEVEVPGSKSITNRALLLSALTDGVVQLDNVQFSDDSAVFIGALSALGFSLRVDEAQCRVTVEGCGGRLPCPASEIDVGSAGTAARFLTAMLGVSDAEAGISASAQMQKRPMRPLFEALLALGARIDWRGKEWHLPVDLAGAARRAGAEEMPESPFSAAGGGGLAEIDLDISESTQFLSALLMVAPMLPCDLCIHVTSEKKSGPYIDMTRQMMRQFGVDVRFEADALSGSGAYYIDHRETYTGTEQYRVEPDVSAACYFYAAAAVTGGSVLVKHVRPEGLQGDLRFLDVLEQMGCLVENGPDGITVTGPAPGGLHGISVDMRDFSDQALTLAAIAPYADGPVEITNIAHVRQQESDRIRAITTNLQRAGIKCGEFPDGVCIEPGHPQPCRIETFEDHRVAMAFAVMGLGADGIIIEDPGCCRKTFANYFDLLDSLLEGSAGTGGLTS